MASESVDLFQILFQIKVRNQTEDAIRQVTLWHHSAGDGTSRYDWRVRTIR